MPYCHLTERERYVISHLYGTHCSAREIGRRLGRSHTTICREVVRNKSEHMRYWYTYTHPKALARRKVARHLKRQTNRKLMRYVERRLRRKWSPEQIANRLLLDYPNDELMRISVEGLYRIIYQRSANGCHLYRQLRRGRKRRRRQVGYGARGSRIVDRVSISERPECVDNRQRYGDWEGDTVVGKRGSGAIVTHVERKSLYFMASKLTEKKAIELTDKSIQLYKKVKPPLRKTLTIDNGTEFADFKRIEEKTQLDVYFADPYASWQRGCNENSNGLLRQYFPKGSDFTKITNKEVARAVRCLNNRPRKSLGYRTPSEVFWALQRGALAN